MRKEDFFEILGELDDDIVKGAKTTMKKKLNWKVWGTMAACLCLIVAGTTALLQQNSSTTPGGISIPGTGSTAGIDAGNSDGMTSTYSVAVYPGTESENRPHRFLPKAVLLFLPDWNKCSYRFLVRSS